MKKFFGVVVVLLLAVSFLAACGPGAPAEFTLSSVTVTPAAPVVNDTVTIGATVTNDGEQSGSCDVSLTIGNYTDSKSVTLDGGASSSVSFSYAATTAGDYTAELSTPDDSKSKSFTVSEAGPGPGPGPGAVPTWSVGDSWIYDCTYENPEGTPKYEASVLNITMVAEVSAGEEEGVTEDSYQLNVTFAPPARRDVSEPLPMTLTVETADVWNSKAHFNFLKQVSPIKELGMPATVTWTYAAPMPSWPVNVGDTWDFTKVTVAAGIEQPTLNREAKVLEVVDITVPAGTFNCYHIVEYDPASPDIYTYEHWFNATVVKSDVKMIDRDTWDGAETRVLTSYSVS